MKKDQDFDLRVPTSLIRVEMTMDEKLRNVGMMDGRNPRNFHHLEQQHQHQHRRTISSSSSSLKSISEGRRTNKSGNRRSMNLKSLLILIILTVSLLILPVILPPLPPPPFLLLLLPIAILVLLMILAFMPTDSGDSSSASYS